MLRASGDRLCCAVPAAGSATASVRMTSNSDLAMATSGFPPKVGLPGAGL